MRKKGPSKCNICISELHGLFLQKEQCFQLNSLCKKNLRSWDLGCGTMVKNMKRKYVLVVPFWGDNHFELWKKYSLPSYLCDNNIPYISKNSEFVVLICTDKKTEKIFKNSDAYTSIAKYCNIEILNISSLVRKYMKISYGYVLTHSYHKAIRSYGTLAPQINFIFLNADFILADGVLKTVDRLVNQGSEIIFCPSFRVVREQFLPKLDFYIKKKNRSEILSMDSRSLVKLAFNHLHSTIVAQTINSKARIASLITNQFYWKVGEEIILGYHFLIFPFVVKPKTVPCAPTGHIDYNMVYDFHPKGEITYITDSDDAFIVETEDQSKEAQHFVFFKKNPKKYYKLLSKWVNHLHYKNSKQLLVFHTENLIHSRKQMQQEKRILDSFVQQIRQKFTSFQPFLNHPYWFNKSLNLQFQFFYSYFSYYTKKYLKGLIKRLIHIDLEKTTLLISNKNRSDFKNNILNINIMDNFMLDKFSNYIINSDAIIYSDCESILRYLSNKKMDTLEGKEIYIFLFNGEDHIKYKNFFELNSDILFAVKNFHSHKTLLSSIKILSSINKKKFDKLLKTLKVIYTCCSIRFMDPFPNFLIFKLDLSQRPKGLSSPS